MSKKIVLPNGHKKLLLLSCCAPCSGIVTKRLAESKVDFTLFFYNPNIHPVEEYLKRNDENKKYADKLGIDFVDADYDDDRWFELIKGLEKEPERGQRCSVCFEMRLRKTSKYALENGFDLYSSTLGISRWKDLEQVNLASDRVGGKVPYWKYNWRKDGMGQEMYVVAREENFYQQKYCGCIYSRRK